MQESQANYPFTTINPNLGVAYYDNKEITLADIPGLVEGAHKGVGLGVKFLRHIERCKILIHLIDLSESDLFENYIKIRNELKNYSTTLIKKKEFVIFNKSDLIERKDLLKKLGVFKKKTKRKFEVISTFKEKNIKDLKKTLIQYAR